MESKVGRTDHGLLSRRCLKNGMSFEYSTLRCGVGGGTGSHGGFENRAGANSARVRFLTTPPSLEGQPDKRAGPALNTEGT